MKKYSVVVSRNDDGSTFKASNSDGYEVSLNGLSRDDSGKGISPMEMMLTAAGGCAAIDVVCLLKQGGITLDEFAVQVNGARNMKELPAYFREVEFKFSAKANVGAAEVEEAIELSLQKYCTVGRTLEAFANMRWSLELNGAHGDTHTLVIDKSQDKNSVLVTAKD